MEHLHLTVESSATKATLRKVMREYFIEEDLMSDESLILMSDESEEEAFGSAQSTELELKRLELEHKAREQEKEPECWCPCSHQISQRKEGVCTV